MLLLIRVFLYHIVYIFSIGCGGVAKIDDLQRKLIKLGREGFRHHTAIGVGHMANILREAFVYYLGYDVMDL